MKHYISNRGNLRGRCEDNENKPEYIEAALGQDLEVVVDVWGYYDDVFLGQDACSAMRVPIGYFKDKRIWCRAKTIDALSGLISMRANCFYDGTSPSLTSGGLIWTPLGFPVTPKSICVLYAGQVPKNVAGVCSDSIWSFKNAH